MEACIIDYYILQETDKVGRCLESISRIWMWKIASETTDLINYSSVWTHPIILSLDPSSYLQSEARKEWNLSILQVNKKNQIEIPSNDMEIDKILVESRDALRIKALSETIEKLDAQIVAQKLHETSL